MITNQKRRDNNHEKKTVPCAQTTTTTTTTSNFEFTNALDRENYKTVTVHTNNTKNISNVTNALQERRQRQLRRRRSNLCGCNSGNNNNNNNNRTRSVENAGYGCARGHEKVKELREQEGELVARCPVPSPDLCGVEEHPTTTSMPTTKPLVQEFCGVGNRNSARVDAFHRQLQL